MKKYRLWFGLLLVSILNGYEVKAENKMFISIEIGEKNYTAVLYDSLASRAFFKQLPLTLTMQDLNSNEKYTYLTDKIPVNSKQVRRVKKGELRVFGSNCLVLFYKDFSTSYSYTQLGEIESAYDLHETLGNGNVKITFK